MWDTFTHYYFYLAALLRDGRWAVTITGEWSQSRRCQLVSSVRNVKGLPSVKGLSSDGVMGLWESRHPWVVLASRFVSEGQMVIKEQRSIFPQGVSVSSKEYLFPQGVSVSSNEYLLPLPPSLLSILF